MSVKPLTSEMLRLACDPAKLPFDTTTEVEPSTTIIGQPRGTRALEFGIGIKSQGYNIFVMGSPGTGRTTAIRQFLEERTSQEAVPEDWVYVYNFALPHQPRALALPAGEGDVLRSRMKQLVVNLKRDLPQAFETESYRLTVARIEETLERQRRELVQPLRSQAQDAGFVLMESPSGLTVASAAGSNSEGAAAGLPAAVVNGGPVKSQPMSAAEIDALSQEEQDHLQEQQRELQEGIQRVVGQIRRLEKETREQLRAVDHEVAEAAMRHHFEELLAHYDAGSKVRDYLEEVQQDVLEQIYDFVPPVAPAADGRAEDRQEAIDLRRYDVNLLVDNGQTQGAPVIIELNPTYENLFGQVEYEMLGNLMMAHFSHIKAGDLHLANGGYLVMHASDLVRQRDTWEALKRAIKAREIPIQPARPHDGPALARSLRPEPIPLRVKIILLGSHDLYYALYSQDEDFSLFFKVRADFGDTMPRDEEHERAYAHFISRRCHEEQLRPFDRSAVAKIVEHGSRLAEHQKKLSAHFGAIADLTREADYWAGRNGHQVVTAGDVRHALAERTGRANQAAEEFREEVLEGARFIATEGGVVGQVNGLSIHEIGDYSFGQPGRITARTFVGDGGILHIERETDMSGPIHEKGVLTLNAYLGGTYAEHQPLSLSASLTFEQYYSGVEGDSAASTELYALLSSLSQKPIKQGISVTGSVNQRGEIQPIGSVNEKIEGFFEVCRARGLTGEQGVIIPASNVVNLMLNEDVVEAVCAGKFHIWPVTTIDEGIELLMGLPAGERDDQGDFPAGTLHHAVQKRLRELALELKSFGDERDSS
jgi:lon-related putative ATP-dependent protease